jgi:hypothetical protein
MPFPFDATLKDLVQRRTRDFEEALGLADPGQGKVLNVDLSTVSAASDVVLGYGQPPRSLVDLNFQASRSADLPARLLLYNALLHHRFRTPVHSLVVLLRPEADDPSLDGLVRYAGQRRGRLQFRYEVERLWRRPVELLLKGSPGTLPLAPLGRLAKGRPLEAQLSGVVRRIAERLINELPPNESKQLLTATFVLTGLRVSRERLPKLFEGVTAMRESSGYQIIFDEGRVEQAQNDLLLIGRTRFGAPRKEIEAAFKEVVDLDRLKRMMGRVVKAASWDDLLETR